jgi:hypothetical protein
MQPDGSMPVAGTCTGPEQRTAVKRNNIELVNFNCSLSEVPYFADGNSSGPILVPFSTLRFRSSLFFVQGLLWV